MKKLYITPVTEVISLRTDIAMLTVTSSLQKGEDISSGDADAPEWDFDFFEDEE